MFIGVDVGGTNTDTVLMDGSRLAGAAKVPTTADVTTGIVGAVTELLKLSPGGPIDAVMVGTTHFTNALLERRDLAPTAVLRLCLPATQLLPPLVDWPDELKGAIGDHTCMVGGGNEFDGREISALDREGIRAAVREMLRCGIRGVAVCGVFSPVAPRHENEAAALINEEAPELRVCFSHENGRMGLLERENAAALNACLGDVAHRTVQGIAGALKQLGITAPLFVSQNDGTLMDTDFAARFPVLTISSGPTNSMRGAAWLSGITDGIVVDVGGTSTDVGALVKGFPRESAVAVHLAGVRTNFRIPDVVSIALGGGTVVTPAPWRMGPESVGYRLAQEALVFGGRTLTTTDLAVATGRADVGDKRLAIELDRALVERGMTEIQARVETAVDRVKLSGEDVPVVLVGGGSILLGNALAGASDVLRPEHAEVANAIGAAIAQVGGQMERVYSLETGGRAEAIADCSAGAVQRAVAAGADPSTVEVVDVEEVPLTYVPSNATLVRVRAVGNLALASPRN
jgi:N-methylhydantoinase A/oxoprolinase/acetone carboxylase beta subunit